jgi:hypothetical protein
MFTDVAHFVTLFTVACFARTIAPTEGVGSERDGAEA